MNININIDVKHDSMGRQLFDAWYAYRQSLNTENYQADVVVTTNSHSDKTDINVLFDYMPENLAISDLEKYDLVFLCNSGESISVSNPTVAQLVKLDKVYLLCDSWLFEDHPLKHKVVTFGYNPKNCLNFWTNSFYPQFFENINNRQLSRSKNIIAINGSNRAHRAYFFEQLAEQVPEITLRSKLSTGVSKLNDSQWESVDDQQFREWVNQYFEDRIEQGSRFNYYNNVVSVGIDNQFGTVTPGYFVLPEYFEYKCVVFLESSWLNSEANLTEKTLKCFYAGAMPFPIGGANANQLVNQIGYYTAWNLLPDNLKKFDSIKDHRARYQGAIDALKWLADHQEVFDSINSQQMLRENQINFFDCISEVQCVKMLNQVLERYTK